MNIIEEWASNATENELLEQFAIQKSAEKQAQEARRIIEDQMVTRFSVDLSHEGVNKREHGGYRIKFTPRFNRKIDQEKLTSIIAENGLDAVASTLFRYKPEINLTAWKRANPSVTALFADAITTSVGRPSVEVTIEE